MPDLQSMLDAFNAPPSRHAMFVHMPIVLTFVGAALALLAAILRSNVTLRSLAIGCQLVLIIAIFATQNSGESAEAAIEQVMTPEVYELIAKHEEMADKAWMFAVAALLSLSISAMLKSPAGTASAWLAVLVSAGSAGWIGATAHHGGELVYKYGVGTPQPVACFDIPGVHSDGRDHQAERAAQDAATQREDAGEDGSATPSAGEADAAKVAFFLDQAFPILSEYCFNCHNHARASRDKSGALDQTSRESLLKGGHGGPAIVPGDPESSLLIRRLRGLDPDEEIMPPDGQLPEKDIEIIAQWIKDGAVWVNPSQR